MINFKFSSISSTHLRILVIYKITMAMGLIKSISCDHWVYISSIDFKGLYEKIYAIGCLI